jgi:hypothetical protein
MVLTPAIRNQDATDFLGAMIDSTATGQQAWDFTKAHWNELGQKLASYERNAIVGTTSSFCDAKSRDDVTSFFAGRDIAGAQRTLKESVERINSCINVRSEQQSNLESWLAQQSKTTAAVH